MCAGEAEPTGFAQFHIVTNGSCLLERYCGETFKLEAGSILLLPQGDSHVVRSASRGGSYGAPIGYDSESAFSRAFRKRYGISPGRLRARHEGRSLVRNDIQSASDAQT
jgi:hypothetical protein